MTVFLLSLAGGLLAFELWGSVDLVAGIAIRAITSPLSEPWRDIRRAELASLIEPCKGERRLYALARVIATASVLTLADLRSLRLRRPGLGLSELAPRNMFQEGLKSEEKALVAIFYTLVAAVCLGAFVVSSVLALLLGAALWQVALGWLALLLTMLLLALSKRTQGLVLLPVFALATTWFGLVVIFVILVSLFSAAIRFLTPRMKRAARAPKERA